MLNRRAILILSVLILVMLASDIWQVTHGEPWSMALFTPPFIVTCMVVTFVERERDVLASVDALAAWREWASAIGISSAAIFTVLQLLPVVPLGIPLPTSELIWRVFLAACGLPFVVIGNRAPKLPPLQSRRPGMLSLGAAEQRAITRLAGWLLVSLGVTMIVSALFFSSRMIVVAIGCVGLATLVLILVNRFEPIVTKFRGAAK
jgi:hypothetical protein